MSIRPAASETLLSRRRSTSIDSSSLESSDPLLQTSLLKPKQGKFGKILTFLRTPVGLTLTCTLVSWLIGYFICRHLFWRDPESWFYNPSKVYDLQYSHQRQIQGRRLVEAAENGSQNVSLHASGTGLDPVICVGLITVKRKHVQYLNDTVGTMLLGLSSEERSAINVQLLFADLKPEVHPDWDKQWLGLLDHWSGYNLSDEKLEELHELKRQGRIAGKATLYVITFLSSWLRE